MLNGAKLLATTLLFLISWNPSIPTEEKQMQVMEVAAFEQSYKQNTVSRGEKRTELGEFKMTAYTAGFESTGKTPSHPAYGITKSGAKVEEGLTISVDPKVIPLGSLVYIEEVGYRVAQDTGGNIKGNRIDIYIPDLKEAKRFGVKKLKVWLIK